MKCNDDSCDGSHCRRCGGHFFWFYSSATICSECISVELQAEVNAERVELAEQAMENEGGAPLDVE